MLHGAGIFTYIYHKFKPFMYGYIVPSHGASGFVRLHTVNWLLLPTWMSMRVSTQKYGKTSQIIHFNDGFSIYIYIYTSIFQRVLFEPQGMVYRHPLSSIQHPLEDPGLCVKTFFLYFYRVWVTPCSTGLRPGDVFHYFQHPFFGPTYFWFNILLNFSKTFGPKAPHT